MDEMLGHHDFLLGHYASALTHYERVIGWGAPSKAVRKRAIVCYIEGRQVDKALELFTPLVAEDAAYVAGRDRDREECPCPRIVQVYAAKVRGALSLSDMIALGMLWLYCDPHISALWLGRALELDPQNSALKSILNAMSSQGVEKSSTLIETRERM